MDQNFAQNLFPLLQMVRKYHQHTVWGMDKMPEDGRVLLVVNHSLATYDISLLCTAIYEATGRLARPLADHLFFKFPYLGEMVELTGGVEGTPGNAKQLLEDDEIVVVAPGGMREALRPSHQRYRVLWEKRRGFARLAFESQTPVVLALCPKADDMYDVYENTFTKFVYSKFKVPFFLARGLGLSLIPKPVRLTHFLSDPIVPPVALEDPKKRAAQIDRFHKKIIKEAQKLIGEAIANPEG